MSATQRAYDELIRALQRNGIKFNYGPDANSIARDALIEAINQFEPGLIGQLRLQHYFPKGRDGAAEIKHSMTNAMRALGVDIAAGTAEAVEPGSLQPAIPDFRPSLPTVQVFFKQPVTYIDEHGNRQRHSAWNAEVVVPLAEKAVAEGLAVRMDSEEGKKAFERFKAHRGSTPKVSRGSNVSYFAEELVKIEIDLPTILEKERNRLKTEWLAAQQAAQ
jgi:hypothetical protein